MMTMKLKRNPEQLLAAIIAIPSLYYCIANLYGSIVVLYFICFLCGSVSYLFLKKRPRVFLIVIFCIVLEIGYSSIINHELWPYILDATNVYELSKSKLIVLLFLYLPALLFCLPSKLQYDKLLSILFKWSIPLLLLTILVNIQRLQSNYRLDYMTIAYQTLLWDAVCIMGMVQCKSKLPLLLIVPASIFILIGGSRGALLCLIGFVFILYCGWVLSSRKDRLTAKSLSIVALIILIMIGSAFLPQILGSVSNSLGRSGYSSRNIVSIANSDFFNNDDRNNLQAYMFPHIFDHLLGSGVFSDRFMSYSRQYAHNIFLEMILDYGIIGFGLCVYILVLSVQAAKIVLTEKSVEKRLFVGFALMIIYFKFMYSASYLESSEALFALGILYNTASKRLK